MRKLLLGLSMLGLVLATGCQQTIPAYQGNCPIRAQDAGFCPLGGNTNYGIALDPNFPA